ncbi:MAG TPA: nucleoside triphosphate pyrophosphohydrolase, partial [Patescibacteria group bacterium]|nr:nucleoside triphosphate pyrophosphohydrolase [Patescibacteria group bacterium]
DKVPTLIEATGSKIDVVSLDDKEFDNQLRLKLQEETQEVIASTSPMQLQEELVDLLEVVDAICYLHNINKESLYAQTKKNGMHVGDFLKENLYLLHITCQDLLVKTIA